MTNTNDYEFNAIAKIIDENVEEYGSVQQAVGRGGWDNFPSHYSRAPYSPLSNITVKPEYSQSDYGYYRPGESLPSTAKGKMAMAFSAYENVPIVRNVVDMMSDFTIEGIRIHHPDRNKKNFLDKWTEKINFTHVSERISNMLYTMGTAPVKILEGQLTPSIEKQWKKIGGKDDIKLTPPKVSKRKIPLGYRILNPLTMEVIGGDIATFVGRPIYGLRVSEKFKMDMRKMEKMAIQNERFRDILSYIPDELKIAVKGNKQIVPLDQQKLEVLFYKKNDWQTWPTPFLSCIFERLIQLEKLHLADSSALDGAISQIRLWKLGIYNPSNPAHSILPKKAAMNKLRDILARLGTGVLDIVWGPELDFKESSSQVHHYLGSEKYKQVMNEIHSGLGVPQTLTGTSQTGSNSGFTNNAISMRTLIERLEYGRKILVNFWNKELVKIQKALGWVKPAKVVFDRRVLADEAVERKFILDLWDREILPTETVLELCSRDPELEILRVQRERKRRDNGRLPPKASPYHNAEREHELKKIVLQSGGVCPSEVGLQLEEKDESEECLIDKQGELQMKLAKEKTVQTKTAPKGEGGDGRPKNKKDSEPRKKRKDKPKSFGFVDLFMWGNDAQAKVNDMITPFFLNYINKKNLRSLNKNEFEQFENFKFSVFARLEPYSDISIENVYNILEGKQNVDPDIIVAKEVLCNQFKNKHERKPTVEELRQIQSSAYSLRYEDK